MDRQHNLVGARAAAPNDSRWRLAAQRMLEEPYELDRERREAVLGAVRGVCAHRGWDLIAAHVRTNHIHAVISADVTPEVVLHDFKAYSTRALNQVEPHRINRWARRGSTRYLWSEDAVREATRYVLRSQGEAMEIFPAMGKAAP